MEYKNNFVKKKVKCGLPVNDYVRFLLTKPPKKTVVN